MKKKRFSRERIIAPPKEAEAGATLPDLARKDGVCEGTLYRWKTIYGGMDISEAKRLKPLEEENQQLKHLVADLSPDGQVPKYVNSEKW